MGVSRIILIVLILAAVAAGSYGFVHHIKSSAPAPFQSGIASWYGSEEEGKPTASGEAFNRHKFTAASPTLPFNTLVRVTNESNGRGVQVRINDRGPYRKDRILDLSEAAADTLGMKTSGTAPVKVEVVDTATAEAVNGP